jgi:hypothetical protein
MDSSNLRPDQCRITRKRVMEMKRYLRRVNERMQRRRFPHDDQLWKRVSNAENALHSLWVDLHYRSCNMGLGDEVRGD